MDTKKLNGYIRDGGRNMETVRVVVADDNLQLREMIAGYLGEQNGIEVVGEASNGLETLELLQKQELIV